MITIYYPLTSLSADGYYAATIGFFDGVHRGHRYLLDQLQHEACNRGMKSMAITFDRHPRQVVQPGWQPQLLTTPDEKEALIAQTGIDVLVILCFDDVMAKLTARQFMSDVLHRQLHVGMLLTGYDNRFGHGRSESFADYERYGRELDMEVVCAHPLRTKETAVQTAQPTEQKDTEERVISSSLVRHLLADGDVACAAKCLGRPYSICGKVVKGEQNGHALGFPTANLMPTDTQKLIPAKGAYAVVATLADGTRHGAMTNIGTRPTFHGLGLTLETNIFDVTGDLYGQPLTIDFIARLRDEQPFDSPEELARQLAQDRRVAEQLLTANPNA